MLNSAAPASAVGRGWSNVVTVLAGLLICAAGTAVRFRFLDHPMRYDEAHSYLRYGSQPVGFIVTHYESPNNHVLYNLLVHAVTAFGDPAPRLIRLPALVAGVSLIPLTGLLAWRLYASRSVVLLSMMAVAGSSVLVEYSANARGYSLAAAFATLLALCTLKLIRRPQSRGLWIAGGLAGALGIYTIPVALLPVLGLGLGLVAAAVAQRRSSDGPAANGAQRHSTTVPLWTGVLLGMAVCAGCSLLLYSPILVRQGLRATIAAYSVSRTVYEQYLTEQGGSAAALWAMWTRDTSVGWRIILLAGLSSFCWLSCRQSDWRRKLVSANLAVLPLAALVGGLPMVPTAWILVAPLAYVCAAEGLVGACALAFQRRIARQVKPVVLAISFASAALSLRTVAHREHLCAWEHELVDVERILDQCESTGFERCALVAPYTPATTYYLLRRGIAALNSPDAPQVRRVYIAADARRSLVDLWNEGTPGYEDYSSPQLCRRFSRSTLFAAERIRIGGVDLHTRPDECEQHIAPTAGAAASIPACVDGTHSFR